MYVCMYVCVCVCVCLRMRDGVSVTSQITVVTDCSLTSLKFPFTIVNRLRRRWMISVIKFD